MTHPLNTKKISAIQRFIIWQFKARIIKGVHVHPWIEGSSFYVKKGEHGLTSNIYTGLCEFSDMGFLLHLLKQGDLFVDVGANSGSYTILASAVSGAASLSIEPVPTTFSRLQANIELNSIQDLVVPLNIGIGQEAGLLNITLDHDSTNHFVIGSVSERTTPMRVRTLDEVVTGSPVLIKIDVEGWEINVLKGASATLSDKNLLALIVEINESGVRFGFSDESILNLLHSYGFYEHGYSPLTREFWKISGKNMNENNTIFIRDLDQVVSRINLARHINVFGTPL
jgi:FkbM family methyltransferase